MVVRQRTYSLASFLELFTDEEPSDNLRDEGGKKSCAQMSFVRELRVPVEFLTALTLRTCHAAILLSRDGSSGHFVSLERVGASMSGARANSSVLRS